MAPAPKDSKAQYQDLEQLRDSLSKQVNKLRSELQDCEKKLNAVTTTMELLSRGSVDTEAQADSYLKQFRGLTHVQALIKIAHDNGNNRFKITEATKLLVAAGLVTSKKNASNIIFNDIQRSEKFRRVAPGEYELIEKPVSATLTFQTENLKRA